MNVVTSFLMSLTAVPIIRGFNNWDIMSDPMMLFIGGIGVLAFVALIVYVNDRLSPKAPDVVSDWFVYVFVVFAFTSVVDLCIGLELHGIIDGYMAFYFKEGEPYLYTPHGMIINYWDGTGHYVMGLGLLYCINNRISYRYLGLYWVGSIMNSMPVLLLGGLTGKYGHKVKPSFFLNTPYVLCPLLFGYRILSTPRRGYSPAISVKKRSAAMLLLDAFLALGLALLILIFVGRGVAASGSPSYYFELYTADYEPYLLDATNYGAIQALLYSFYYVPACVAAVYALYTPGCKWLPDIATLMAGGVVQGQLSYMHSSLAQWTVPESRVPGDAMPVFWFVNLAVAIVPQLLMMRSLSMPRFFSASAKKTE